MMQFSGFMQTMTGIVPSQTDRSFGQSSDHSGVPIVGETDALAGETNGSFIDLIRKLINDSDSLPDADDSAFNLKKDSLVSAFPSLESLQAMVTGSPPMDELPVSPHLLHALNADITDGRSDQIPPEVMNTIAALIHSKQSAEINADDPLLVLKEMMIGKEDNPHARQTLTSVSDESSQKEALLASPTIGQPKLVQFATIGQKDDGKGNFLSGKPNNEANQGWLNQDQDVLGKEKNSSPTMTFPFIPKEAKHNSQSQNTIPIELPVTKNSLENPQKQVDISLVQKEAKHNSQSQNSIPIELPATKTSLENPQKQVDISTEKNIITPTTTAMANQNETESEQFPSNHRNKQNLSTGIRVTELNDDGFEKDLSSDSIKSVGSDLAKANIPVQEKTIGPEMMLPAMADKKVGQPVASAHTDERGTKTFQTAVMDQIVQKASLRSIHGRSEMQITLKPEFLGNVHMTIATEKQQLVVRMMTDQPMVKEIIETHLHQLKAELQNQGLVIDKFDVQVNSNSDQQQHREQFSQLFRNDSSENRRRQSNRQSREPSDAANNDEGEEDNPLVDGVNFFA